MTDKRLYSPSTARNRAPILGVLRSVLPSTGVVLEVASGSGEHAVYFAEQIPALTFAPSDPSEAARDSIAAWIVASGLANVREPLALDAATAPWPIDHADALICVNMVHISPWAATVGLFENARAILPAGAPLYLYGPYKRGGAHTAPSNAAFEDWLKAQDPAYGVRDLEAVSELAASNGFDAPEIVEMPANNLSVIFRKAVA